MTSTTALAAAFEPMRAIAMNEAEARARRAVAHILDELAKAGNDAQVYAPYPSSTRMSKNDYIAARDKYQFVRALTRAVEGQRRIHPTDPDLRVRNDEAIESYVAHARQSASESLDAFVAKMNGKVGEHSDAKIVYGHEWRCVLAVTTPAGVQNWKSQMIVNVSKYGRVFNQWPSRIVK